MERIELPTANSHPQAPTGDRATYAGYVEHLRSGDNIVSKNPQGRTTLRAVADSLSRAADGVLQRRIRLTFIEGAGDHA